MRASGPPPLTRTVLLVGGSAPAATGGTGHDATQTELRSTRGVMLILVRTRNPKQLCGALWTACGSDTKLLMGPRKTPFARAVQERVSAKKGRASSCMQNLTEKDGPRDIGTCFCHGFIRLLSNSSVRHLSFLFKGYTESASRRAWNGT